MSKDPIGFGGGVSNLYEYCVNDPKNIIDIDGMQIIPSPFIPQAIGGLSDFLDNYFKMRKANFQDADKYFHCMANCEATKKGAGGKAMAYAMSEAREIVDEHIKGDASDACMEDREANNWGRSCPPNVPCKERCNRFRPVGLNPKY